MTARRWHRLLGLILLLPLCGWIVTGIIFFVKPGYADAYDMPAVRTYCCTRMPAAPLPDGALEVRLLRTVIGEHLLVRTADGWSHYDAATLLLRDRPSPGSVRALIEDAVRDQRQRYGRVVSVNGLSARTSTGVRVTLDWKTLSLQQRGADTERIDLFYRIHYLQWTGIQAFDRVLGVAGLAILFALTILGLRLAVRPR